MTVISKIKINKSDLLALLEKAENSKDKAFFISPKMSKIYIEFEVDDDVDVEYFQINESSLNNKQTA